MGSTHPEALQAAVKQHRADLGVALDGDADRVVMVDHQGNVVDGDQILFIIARHLLDQGRLQGGVVGTLMSNLGLELSLKELDVPFARANVGDRYVVAEMVSRNWGLGGESSGHVVCGHATGTGDGIVTALQVVSAMRTTGKSLAEMAGVMQLYPQRLINVRVDEKVDLSTQAEIQSAVESAEAAMGERGRVLLRPSGTEPLIRVMVEADDAAMANDHAQAIAKVVESELCQ